MSLSRPLFVTSLALLPGAAAYGQTTAPPPVAASTSVPVRSDGLVATWYPPASGRRGPVILALGGSEGGERSSQAIAATLAKQGYGVLALAYFKADGLPGTLEEVPLEYFDRAIAWIKHQPLADPGQMGIFGISIGGETCLVVASRHPELRAVVAAVPSSVVWQGINLADYRSVKSSYSIAGKPIPFLPYDTKTAYTGIFDLYQRSLATLDQHPDAIIPVERIGGAVLLLSAKGDTLWPSTAMSEQVMRRLDAKGFKPEHRHIAYPDAGHGAMSPPRPNATNSAYDNAGGTPAGNAAARTAIWREVVAFFDRVLGAPKR